MGQITIYLDSETEKKMINTIKKSGKSKSKWVAYLIREKTAGSWPDNIINLAGAWSDLHTAEEIRKNMGGDMKKESIFQAISATNTDENETFLNRKFSH